MTDLQVRSLWLKLLGSVFFGGFWVFGWFFFDWKLLRVKPQLPQNTAIGLHPPPLPSGAGPTAASPRNHRRRLPPGYRPLLQHGRRNGGVARYLCVAATPSFSAGAVSVKCRVTVARCSPGFEVVADGEVRARGVGMFLFFPPPPYARPGAWGGSRVRCNSPFQPHRVRYPLVYGWGGGGGVVWGARGFGLGFPQREERGKWLPPNGLGSVSLPSPRRAAAALGGGG